MQTKPSKISKSVEQIGQICWDPKKQIPKQQEPTRCMFRCNSTGTLFLRDTMDAPNPDQITSCVAKAVILLIRKDEYQHSTPSRRKIVVDVFDERKHPLGDDYNYKSMPNLQQVRDYVERLVARQCLSPEVAVMSCAYISRLIRNTGTQVNIYNWRRILLGALLIADKIWEETAVWNADYRKSFPFLSLANINQLERQFLYALDFNLTLRASTYAHYYFQLRSIADHDSFPMKPLNRETANELEAKSRSQEEAVKVKIHAEKKAAKSVDMGGGSNPSITLEQFRKSYLRKGQFSVNENAFVL